MGRSLAGNAWVQLPSIEELGLFLDQLRLKKRVLTPDEVAASQKILLLAYADGANCSLNSFKTMLGTICAKTPEQQAEFYRQFEAWRASAYGVRGSEHRVRFAVPSGPAADATYRGRARALVAITGIAVLGISIAVGLVEWGNPTPVLAPNGV